MAILKVDTISGIGTEGPVFEGDIEFTSQNFLTLPKGNTIDRFPDFKGAPAASARGIFAGGISEPSPTRHNEIDFITIATTGDATDFGDLTNTNQFPTAFASNTRGVIAGGYHAPAITNSMEFVTIATTGNGQRFGDLTLARSGAGSLSNSTRGLIAGGNPETETVDFVTIQSEGNAINFGDLLTSIQAPGGCADLTRAVISGGEDSPTSINTIQFFTIPTQSNATNFGDLSQARRNLASGSSPTLGFFMGGDFQASSYYDRIDFVTIQTLGDATDFGNLSAARSELAAVTSTLRACVGGGYVSPSTPQTNIVEHITMSTTGQDMSDFGDLTVARRQVRGCSNGHGGLG